MITYPFSEPNPVPQISNIYPYFRFDGYSADGAPQDWKMVILENDFIKVFVTPEIGGKVWGAIEKSTGGEFLYFNEVVKFRDIAMRGPWTSGGLEYNFGDIGHIPTASTSVDYRLRENADGSVSCIIGAIDLPSRTKWSVSINLHPDHAYFETEVHWQNATDLPVTYYHWMNAAAKAKGNLEFLYPGSNYIGHGGELYPFPMKDGRNISYYENNNFGGYKSYHVLNAYADFFGGYWHDDDFGFGHLSDYDDKPGKKIWIWGLSEQGMIWEDLLTDEDGQYVEYQSGKLFNQAAAGSTKTPFKHREFAPHDTDHMMDRWFPLVGTGGMVEASEYAVLNIEQEASTLQISLSALQEIDDRLILKSEGAVLLDTIVRMGPLELFEDQLDLSPEQTFTLSLGGHKLNYSSDPDDLIVDRPLSSNPDFNWESSYGHFIQGLEKEKQRQYSEAHRSYQRSLLQEPAFMPALNRLALNYYRRTQLDSALYLVRESLGIDTYDPEANYLFGLIHEELGQFANAKSGFGIAAQSMLYRSAALTGLARIHLREGDRPQVIRLASEALRANQRNVSALEMLALQHRISEQPDQALKVLADLEAIDPTSSLLAYEKDLWNSTDHLTSLISNELPEQSYLELALLYHRYGQSETALDLLTRIPDYPIAQLWLAELDEENTTKYLADALDISPEMVFPHRRETLTLLEKWSTESDHWKLKYYRALIYWNQGRLEKAKTQFLACEEAPDFAPFYLAKALLFENDPKLKKASIQQALKTDPDNWRTNLAYVQELFEEQQWEALLPICEKFTDQFPAFGMLKAKALIQAQRPDEAADFLSTYVILPFEGANESRAIYHEACVRAALDAYLKGNTRAAQNYAVKARDWPRNLGVGKPYVVDTRMEDFLSYKCAEKSKDKTALQAYQQRLLDWPDTGESPNLQLQLRVLEEVGDSRRTAALYRKYPFLLKTSQAQWPDQMGGTKLVEEILQKIK